LLPSLAEAAGRVVLEEHMLDDAIAAKLASMQLTISAAEAEKERLLLVTALQTESQADAAQAQQLLQDVRASRGLGPQRFAALLRRNAGLRAIVHDSISITPAQEATEIAIATEPRVRARLLLHERQGVVSSSRDRVLAEATPSDRRRVFAELAVSESQDASAPRGGLLAPLSLSDPSVPRSLRQALSDAQPGGVSDVLSVPGGFAIVMHDGTAPASMSDTPEARERILSSLRTRLERLAMDAEASRLLASRRVTILDASLIWSWEQRAR
jgi:hypothetical protein